MPTACPSSPPVAVVPIARAKALRMARKPALEAREHERLQEEQALAEEFGKALDAESISNVAASRLMGISEVRVRAIRRRECPLQLRQVGKLPAPVRRRLLAALDRICNPETLAECVANDLSSDV